MAKFFSPRKGPLPLTFFLLFLLSGLAFGQIEVWSSRYNGDADTWDEAVAMVVVPDGNVVLTGNSGGTDGTFDIVTAKFSSSNGEIIWARRWRAFNGSWENGRALACDNMGNIFVVGLTVRLGVDTDYVTIKYRADGTELWVRRYNNGRRDVPVAVVPDEVGGCFVTGYSYHYSVSDSNSDYLTIHYSPSGAVEWIARYNGPGNGQDVATGLVWNQRGALYVTGYSWTDSLRMLDYLTIKYNADGETIWTRRYDGTSTAMETKDDYALAITLDDAGDVYVTGRAGEEATWYDATTIKYTSRGQTVWVNRFDWGENATDCAGEIAVDKDGFVYCAGFTETNLGSLDMLVFKLSPNGVRQWQDIYFSVVGEDDFVNALCVDRYNNMYITGSSTGSDAYYHWVTIKYNKNGARVWVALHGALNEEDDEPNAIAVNTLGDVFVAGYDVLEGNEDYALVKYSAPDVGVTAIIQPRDTLRLDAEVIPRVKIKNYSALNLTFPVRLEIGNFYFDMEQIPYLSPYDSTIISFAPWVVRDLGEHNVKCNTMLVDDKEPGNDTLLTRIKTVSPWEQLEEMPAGPNEKDVNDGGALTFAQESLIFAFKGNNRSEFYCYNINRQTWIEKESIPAPERKRVKGGACLAADGSGNIYALKGNNTLEFWRYSIADNQWTQLKDFPEGAKKVKGGAGMIYARGFNQLFVLRGANTTDFYTYFIDGDSWGAKKSVPTGERSRRVKDGSAIAFDGDSIVYLLKGNTYEFWAYNLRGDSWIRMPDIPDSRINPKRRKFKKGACIAYDPEYGRVYASKGGKQTEFWYFDVFGSNWVETTDTLPKSPSNRGPYAGAAMVYARGKIYMLKGNKTREFWCYHANFPLNPPSYGQQARRENLNTQLRLAIAPNPLRNQGILHYTLLQPGKVRLAVYDISGRVQRVIASGHQSPGAYSLRLDTKTLSAGVYLARLEVEGVSVTEKILVVK
ncbi:MAG: T9SS type A sorting domain-containing protein [candidate division WOR-3 bacterium]